MEPNLFGDIVSDLPRSNEIERDLEKELFGKKDFQSNVIDAYEQMLGYKDKPAKKTNVKFKSRIFSPGKESEQELLNQLLNDKEKFNIVMWKDTWTAHGDFKVFIIYSENLEPKEKEENLGELTND